MARAEGHSWYPRVIDGTKIALNTGAVARHSLFAMVLVLLVACALAPLGATQSEFEARNQDGLAKNPEGVKLVLRTESGRTRFHLYESIPLEWVLTSELEQRYKIELDETSNSAGPSNDFDFDPIDGIRLPYPFGVDHILLACCSSERKLLSRIPTVVKHELTDYLRFEKPGTYSFSLTTRRVYCMGCQLDSFDRSDLVVTSNVLTLTILPDDASWDSQRLAELLRVVDDPAAKAEHDGILSRASGHGIRLWSAAINKQEQTPFGRAQKALNALDTPPAIHERVARMGLETKKEIADAGKFGGGSLLPQPLLRSSSRPDLVVAALVARAKQPSFGVDSAFFSVWTQYLVQSEHPEYYRAKPFGTVAPPGPSPHGYYVFDAENEILKTLDELVDSKTAEAASTTRVTIKIVRDSHDYELKSDPDQPAPKN